MNLMLFSAPYCTVLPLVRPLVRPLARTSASPLLAHTAKRLAGLCNFMLGNHRLWVRGVNLVFLRPRFQYYKY